MNPFRKCSLTNTSLLPQRMALQQMRQRIQCSRTKYMERKSSKFAKLSPLPDSHTRALDPSPMRVSTRPGTTNPSSHWTNKETEGLYATLEPYGEEQYLCKSCIDAESVPLRSSKAPFHARPHFTITFAMANVMLSEIFVVSL